MSASLSPDRRRRRTSAGHRASGFTLIEILVVIVIVGIIVAVAMLSFGIIGTDRNLQQHARRLSSLIELATDESTMQGRDFGIEFLQQGYRFVEWDPLLDQWHELLGDDFLRERRLEEELEFELVLEDRRVLLDVEAADTQRDEDETDRDPSDDYVPHVLIMSSGDVTPFDLRIVRPFDRAAVTVSMTPEGELEIATDDAAF